MEKLIKRVEELSAKLFEAQCQHHELLNKSIAALKSSDEMRVERDSALRDLAEVSKNLLAMVKKYEQLEDAFVLAAKWAEAYAELLQRIECQSMLSPEEMEQLDADIRRIREML